MNTILFVGEHSRTYNVSWHIHDNWELVYCTSGEGEFRFENGTVLPYRAGDAVAIPQGLRHTNLSPGGFTNIFLTIDSPAFPDREPFRVTDDAGQHLKTAFSQARYYYISDILRRELVISALGELICGYMMVYRENKAYSGPVEQIRSLILNRYAEPDFALDDGIRSLPFHYDYLRKLFKKEMGITPLEFMTSLRMKKAEILLTAAATREYSVGEIAELCGYDNPLYFSRVFRKSFGCSPTQYAKKNPSEKSVL